jgi:hypothetical protein
MKTGYTEQIIDYSVQSIMFAPSSDWNSCILYITPFRELASLTFSSDFYYFHFLNLIGTTVLIAVGVARLN